MKGLLRPSTCKTCPFRGGFHLAKSRRREIMQSTLNLDETFRCHSEVDYEEEDEWMERAPTPSDARQCAGASTLLMREEKANQVLRWGVRLGEDPQPDPQVPFQTWKEWVHEPEFSTDFRGGEVSRETSI